MELIHIKSQYAGKRIWAGLAVTMPQCISVYIFAALLTFYVLLRQINLTPGMSPHPRGVQWGVLYLPQKQPKHLCSGQEAL